MRLSDLLRHARTRFFVGREEELELFNSLLGPAPSCHVLYIHGVAGIGKTALLDRFAQICQERSISIDHVRPSESSPFKESLQQIADRNASERQVLIIDPLEPVRDLENWLSSEFLPQLSAQTITVLAGRLPPTKDWLADPGWNGLLKVHELPLLSAGESRQMLDEHAIRADHQDNILRYCKGHPLALALCVRDQAAHKSSFWTATPGLTRELLERLEVKPPPSSLHRVALESVAVLRVVSQPLLAHMLQISDAHDLFDWLREQPVLESVGRGLRPREVAREALVAELRWRNPDRYRELHDRARLFYQAQLAGENLHEQESVLFDYFFLHRDSLSLRDRFVWDPPQGYRAETLESANVPEFLASVERFEGAAAAERCQAWLGHQIDNSLLFSEPSGRTIGFMHFTSLLLLEEEETEPQAVAARQFLEERAPLRAGEQAYLIRFWMDCEVHQGVSISQSLAMVHILRHSLFTPGLAFTFWSVRNPEFWAPLLAYAGFFPIGDSGLYGHDWRSVPPSRWLEELAAREGLEVEAEFRASTLRPLLEKGEFSQAVRTAIRNFSRAQGLEDSPLLSTRLVQQKMGPNGSRAEQIRALQTLLEEGLSRLESDVKLTKILRTLRLTYIQAAQETQEKIAEQLHLPFGTYRRHLAQSQELLVELLWKQEILGDPALRGS